MGVWFGMIIGLRHCDNPYQEQVKLVKVEILVSVKTYQNPTKFKNPFIFKQK